MKNKEKATCENNKKGISFVVLVITIIVMIIITSTIILNLNGINIIEKAKEAVKESNRKEIETMAQRICSEGYLVNKTNATIKEQIVRTLGKDKTDEFNIVVTDVGVIIEDFPEGWEKSVSEVVKGVPIPKGFVISPYDGENTVNEGLVIYELSKDEMDEGVYDITKIDEDHQHSLENRNQFVWVPVDKDTFEKTFVRRDFTTQNTTNTLVVNEESKYYALGTTNKFWEVDPTTDETDANNKKFIQVSATPPSTIIKEVQEMYESVKEYGGFYIARYEAGLGTDPTDSKVHRKGKSTNASDLPTGHDNVYFKMGQIPYTYIPWNWTNKMDQETNGAVSVSRSLYPNDSSNTTGVISTLTYAVQWDTILQWFKTNGKYGEGNIVESITNSIVYGNFQNHQISKGDLNPNAKYWDYTNNSSGSYELVTYIDGQSQEEKSDTTSWVLSTGALKNAKVNNIYDMAGNMWEWTMEGYSTMNHLYRGGYFNRSGAVSSISYRGSSNPIYCNLDITFRPSLYIK